MCVVRLYWFLNWIEKKCVKLLTTLEKILLVEIFIDCYLHNACVCAPAMQSRVYILNFGTHTSLSLTPKRRVFVQSALFLIG